jgi:hypothetical protein
MHAKRFILLLAFMVFYLPGAFAQQTAPLKETILVLSFTPQQLGSNVFYMDELALLNDTTEQFAQMYSDTLVQSLVNYEHANFRFVTVTPEQAAMYHRRSLFAEWKNQFGESYIAITSDSLLEVTLKTLMDIYKADYVLTLNYYEIYRSSTPAMFSPDLDVRHIIHYDLFTYHMFTASAGTISIPTNYSSAAQMARRYPMFTHDLLARLEIFRTEETEAGMRQRYFRLRDQKIANRWGAGITGGWGSPYGALGLELLRQVGANMDINAGLGYSYSGFKGGIGARYYLLQYGSRFRPFVGINLVTASGGVYTMGDARDDAGNYINPQDVSQFRLPANQAVHGKVGFRMLGQSQALLVAGGYSQPFRDRRAKFEKGLYTAERQAQADLMTVGGLEVSVSYIYYFLR